MFTEGGKARVGNRKLLNLTRVSYLSSIAVSFFLNLQLATRVQIVGMTYYVIAERGYALLIQSSGVIPTLTVPKVTRRQRIRSPFKI